MSLESVYFSKSIGGVDAASGSNETREWRGRRISLAILDQASESKKACLNLLTLLMKRSQDARLREYITAQTEIVLNEELVNAVAHGSGGSKQKAIGVVFRAQNLDGLLSIGLSLQDEGDPIDMKKFEPIEAVDLGHEHGRGSIIVGGIIRKNRGRIDQEIFQGGKKLCFEWEYDWLNANVVSRTGGSGGI